jgi:crotonobetainyl-CoA:carnitine CoA-transferase CaiB-like acyl-CoA transferase
MSITGEAGAPPLRAGIPIGDLGGGLFAAIGILSALNQRHATGSGQHVDISMQDCQISMLNYMATMYLMSGVQPPAVGNRHFIHVPYGTFKTRSRYLILACMGDAFYLKLAALLDDPELLDPKFATQPIRWEHREFINQRVQHHIKQYDCEYWLTLLQQHRIPAAPVNDFAHALTDPQVLARDMIVTVPLNNGGQVQQPGNPVKLSAAEATPFTPPPGVGQHTDQILGEFLKLSPLQIEELRQAGVIT